MNADTEAMDLIIRCGRDIEELKKQLESERAHSRDAYQQNLGVCRDRDALRAERDSLAAKVKAMEAGRGMRQREIDRLSQLVGALEQSLAESRQQRIDDVGCVTPTKNRG